MLIFRKMKSVFSCLALFFYISPAKTQTNELWYKNWQNPFLMLFEEDTFDVAESRLFLPYHIFESSRKKKEIVYKYKDYKQQGYYRCIYKRGKLKSRVLYLDNYNHTFPWSVSIIRGKVFAKGEKFPTPLKQASYFTQISKGHIEEKAFQADTFLQTVNYFMANGRIDSVKISRPGYSLNYRVAYDSLGRLLTVQAVENGRLYVAQKRVYTTYSSDTYHFSVEDTLFGYSSPSNTGVNPDSFPQRAVFIGRAEDTSYLFTGSHTFFHDNEYIATYGIYRIQNGTFLEPERSSAGRCGQSRRSRASQFPAYVNTIQERQGVTFMKRTVANKRFETFCAEDLPAGGNYVWQRGGYTLQRKEKKKGSFSVYSKVSDQSRSCDYAIPPDSNKIMEVLVR